MKMPAVFISDLGPMPAVEESTYTQALGALGRLLPVPRAIVIMSGHWEADDVLKVTGANTLTTIYDYVGFPNYFYDVRYPAKGDPALATRIVGNLSAAGFPTEIDPTRGLDHGAWAPLSRVYPNANIPVVQLSVPAGRDPNEIIQIGRSLAPLRDAGVLFIAAGALIHNLREMRMGEDSIEADPWALEFERWITERLEKNDAVGLSRYQAEAPQARKAVPTSEHFDPLFFLIGVANGDLLRSVFREMRYGNALLTIIQTQS